MQKITALIGAQYGSEGKGVVAKHLAQKYDVWVRTGGPNAGHSFMHEGRVWKMQALPCGWVNPDATLILGPGAVVNPRILYKEIDEVEEHSGLGIAKRVFVDSRVTPLLSNHIDEEGHIEGEIHKRIGSTGEGVGAARMDWMRRDPEHARPFKNLDGLLVDDTTVILEDAIRQGKSIMLEGTQGCGLSLTHGRWPYVTSNDTGAAQLCADAGIPPHKLTDVILVARTFPIRVCGNSGPLKDEINWDKISERIGRKVEERTTVTKLVRRVGMWDEDIMRKAVRLNAPTEVALTFIDYLNPSDEGCIDIKLLGDKSLAFIDYIEHTFGVDVTLIGTGFTEETGWICIDRQKE